MRATRLLAVLLIAAVLGACGSGGSRTAGTVTNVAPERLEVFAGGRLLGSAVPGKASRLHLPRRVTLRRGRARLLVELAPRSARQEIAHALRLHEPRIDLKVIPVRSSIALRPVRQVLHNDCEATALSMLLAAAGVRVGQLVLQARLPRSGSLDPERVAGSTLRRWGDPERGFVGRAAGGGTAGGFGVYEPPIRALARRYRVRLVDLQHHAFSAVRAVVLAGRPVLAWVGLAPGPYLSWLTPSGRQITVNLNEHAVVVVGAGPGYVLVDNPLSGRRERWSDALFSERWKLLGRRALALPQG